MPRGGTLKPKAIVENVLRPFPPLFRLGSRMYNKVNGGFRSASPGLPAGIRRAFQVAHQLHDGQPSGDYYEFGVFRGHSLLAAQQACDELELRDTRFYGFDSFSGLPSIDGIDRKYNKFFQGQFACPKSAVVKALSDRGFDWSRGELIEGVYEESLTADLKGALDFQPAMVALLDCDLYSSTRDALSWLADLLTNNSILMFDDWYSYDDDPQLGQQKAFAEFLENCPERTAEELWEFAEDGKAFVVRSC